MRVKWILESMDAREDRALNLGEHPESEELRSMWINLLSVCEARLKPGRSGAGEVFLVTLVLNWQKELHFFGMSVSSSYVLMLKEIVLKNHNI